MSEPSANLGISGRLTRAFIVSPLTPLLLLAAIIVGAIALVALPREAVADPGGHNAGAEREQRQDDD